MPAKNEKPSFNERFRKFAKFTSEKSGSFFTFLLAVLIIIVWLVTGPLFNFSDTWQLVINTSTTIITFLMVFIIQNTQNRDAKSVQLKLDELIKSTRASNLILDLDNLSDEELQKLEEGYLKVYKQELKKRKNKVSSLI